MTKGGVDQYCTTNNFGYIFLKIIMLLLFDIFDCFALRRRRHDQIGGDILEMLLSFTDFLAFKQMFLDYKAVSIANLSSALL